MKYAGICVGGPASGQAIVNSSPRLRVECFKQTKLSAGPPKEVKPIRGIDHVEYTHHDVAGVGIWVLQGQTVADAINTMATEYVRHANEMRR